MARTGVALPCCAVDVDAVVSKDPSHVRVPVLRGGIQRRLAASVGGVDVEPARLVVAGRVGKEHGHEPLVPRRGRHVQRRLPPRRLRVERRRAAEGAVQERTGVGHAVLESVVVQHRHAVAAEPDLNLPVIHAGERVQNQQNVTKGTYKKDKERRFQGCGLEQQKTQHRKVAPRLRRE